MLEWHWNLQDPDPCKAFQAKEGCFSVPWCFYKPNTVTCHREVGATSVSDQQIRAGLGQLRRQDYQHHLPQHRHHAAATLLRGYTVA